ncbi:8-oxoguanine glycosylase ogg1 [Dimargaris cristalligena]|uniref:DNA-(apurinic or apyrimidinic site) lyase n=1 Tax=Dimargaris cristalligena TaxID=215637 RepID=A0A4P9ZYM1_9FUNG|nr:8-oxoguanine glycosylase ogg1 [Dimargaris cristalligena]RKP38834.1 DNA glycosylase [Dimargaris cristalligena]|eukprot:RKP38834.1 DNA glycosylase [Dimargaris cristalligena]
MSRVWKDLKVSPPELRIGFTLRSGQSFRWKQTAPEEWTGVVGDRLVTLKQTDQTTLFRTYSTEPLPVKSTTAGGSVTPSPSATTESLLSDYFQLHINLNDCYQRWSELDPNFQTKALRFPGVRVLRQDPFENLISFICSSNNHISRITQMVESLCQLYGHRLGTVAGSEFYTFPRLTALASSSAPSSPSSLPSSTVSPDLEARLRTLGFGYRAKYISKTVAYLADAYGEEAESWLHSLRDKSYADAHSALLKLSGIGPKVADCICLMSLDKSEVIPVDTHVWQIAVRDYQFQPSSASPAKSPAASKPIKSLTTTAYKAVASYLGDLFGQHAGWAHSVLFIADLPPVRGVESPIVQETLIPDTADLPAITKDVRAAKRPRRKKN